MYIRPVQPADARDVRQVLAVSAREAYAETLEEHHLSTFVDVDPEALRHRLVSAEMDDEIVYLGAFDGDCLGFVQMLCGDRVPPHIQQDAFLQSLYVVPAVWREGVGRQLLDTAVEAAPEDVSDMALAVFASNDRARAFYASQGFEQVDSGTYSIDGTAYETAVYARQLTDGGD